MLDPVHVAFAHHGVAGIKRTGAGGVEMRTTEPLHITRGVKHTTRQGAAPWDRNFNEFRPPCLVLLTLAAKDAGSQYLALYATPTKKGWMRHLGARCPCLVWLAFYCRLHEPHSALTPQACVVAIGSHDQRLHAVLPLAVTISDYMRCRRWQSQSVMT